MRVDVLVVLTGTQHEPATATTLLPHRLSNHHAAFLTLSPSASFLFSSSFPYSSPFSLCKYTVPAPKKLLLLPCVLPVLIPASFRAER